MSEEEKQIHLYMHSKNELGLATLCVEKDNKIKRLNNIINELEKDIKNLYTYGIKNNREQKDYLLNRLEGLKALKGVDKE